MISNSLEDTINRAISIAYNLRHEYATLEHLLLALTEDIHAYYIFNKCRVNVIQFKEDLSTFLGSEMSIMVCDYIVESKPTIGFQRVVYRAVQHAKNIGEKEVTGANLLMEFFVESDSYSVYVLYKHNITCLEVLNNLLSSKERGAKALKLDNDLSFDNNTSFISKAVLPNSMVQSSALSEYCIELNQKAMLGGIDKLIGRESEVNRTIDILLRRTKNNPLYVGDPGVGKTAIVEGLALKVINGEVPDVLSDIVIYALDMGCLLAGTRYRGDFEERMRLVVQGISAKKNAVLFIDEIHTIIGAGSTNGGSLDASNLLKPALARGEFRCIGSTTYKEYSTSFAKDTALARRFQKIDIAEPSIQETVKILHGIKSYYEEYHGAKYTDKAVDISAKLAKRYIQDRMLPDAAVDILDEAGAYHKRVHNNKAISVCDIERMVADISKVPYSQLSFNDTKQIKSLGAKLKREIFGQDEAIDILVSSIKLAKAGLRDEKKPMGNYLFAGSTGVGKTELAKQLAINMNMHLARFDMSEYMEPHTISRMIGSPPGYVGYDKGGILTDTISRYPYSVLLLDEMEKAHREVYNILLQVMDYGHITDSSGRVVNFNNVIVIMTTNAGVETMNKGPLGFGNNEVDILQTLESYFSEEFRNRLDTTIVFNHIDRSIMKKIVTKMVLRVQNYIKDKISLKVSPDVINYLVNIAYSKKFGVRYVERIISSEISQLLADKVLFHQSQCKKNKGIMVKMNGDSKVELMYL